MAQEIAFQLISDIQIEKVPEQALHSAEKKEYQLSEISFFYEQDQDNADEDDIDQENAEFVLI